jgi:hypothetical protein
MSTVEVLAPLRLETRFIPPAGRDDGVAEWMLRVRIFPDDFSMPRPVAPPTPAELDRLSEAVASLATLTEADAFATLGATVGAWRALWLWRRHTVSDAAGTIVVDRTGQTGHQPFRAHPPAGLPPSLEVWLIHADGSLQLAASLTVDRAAIEADLDLPAFGDQVEQDSGRLPDTWWLSYRRAVEVGLGVDLDVGAVPPALDALVVLGIGDTEAAEVADMHAASGRLAVLAPGTPTNTVAGEATTDFGEAADTLFPLLGLDASGQPATRLVLTGLTGRLDKDALPILGGELDTLVPGTLAVTGLWPVLWGRAFRDVTGAADLEPDLARWAADHLAVEGPRPAVRIGDQPYGLLPTSAFAAWVDAPGDSLASLESRIRAWSIGWRAGSAAAARAASPLVFGADSQGLVEVLGLHAPSRRWRVRPIADRANVAAARALAGMPPLPNEDQDQLAAAVWRGVPWPIAPIAPAARSGPLPGPPDDEQDDARTLRELCTMEPEPLYGGRQFRLGLVGHLVRESLIAARAIIGEAVVRFRAGMAVELGVPLPLDNEPMYRTHVMQGGDVAVEELAGAADPAARALAEQFLQVQKALLVLADRWEVDAGRLFRSVLSALDTAAFRADPWLIGIAERRLRQMIDGGAPFALGAYGWVDAPAPYAGGAGGPLAPGPTAAGLLHAPSHAQALTAALLRDAAVRDPSDHRWDLTIDSSRVRAALALAERVRLGVHPYEALGLEVERIAGDWETVRTLRKHYPLAPGQQERRVCDGAKVLDAARAGTLMAGLPVDLPDRLAPLDNVLDTYADLLVADGVHALVTGHADLANAAMEAAAGLGAPPDLRAIRTPRAAGETRVAAWVLVDVEPGAAPGDDPAAVADPAFASLVSAQIGPRALHDSDAGSRDARRRLASLLGSGDEALVPSLTGGSYEGLPASGDADLRAALAADLASRLAHLRDLVMDATAALRILDPSAPGAAAEIVDAAGRWEVDLSDVRAADGAAAPSTGDRLAALLAELDRRLAGAVAPPLPAGSTVSDGQANALRRAIRTLAGRADLPVIPIVERTLLPVLRSAPDVDRAWLELVAAVHPRLSWLEARQLDPEAVRWTAGIAAPGASIDPWDPAGPVLVAYEALTRDDSERVGIVVLDAWTDAIPSRRHATTAAFGFNAPKARAPQAMLLAVPPDSAQRLTNRGLLDVVMETREMVHARAARPTDVGGLPYASPSPLVHAGPPVAFLDGWPT